MELQLSVKQTKEDHPVKEIEPLNNEMLLKTRQKLNEILSLTSQWKKAFNQT
jgi:hypothetical protein